jgi:hypothetical protein
VTQYPGKGVVEVDRRQTVDRLSARDAFDDRRQRQHPQAQRREHPQMAAELALGHVPRSSRPAPLRLHS